MIFSIRFSFDKTACISTQHKLTFVPIMPPLSYSYIGSRFPSFIHRKRVPTAKQFAPTQKEFETTLKEFATTMQWFVSCFISFLHQLTIPWASPAKRFYESR